MELRIDNKNYKLEYSIEASLCGDCTEAVSNFMGNFAEAQGKKDVKKMLSGITNIPQSVLPMFYAGLLEHHGEDGDRTVTSLNDAKTLLKKYFKENKEENFYSLMQKLVEQMGNDGFFKQIGLEQIAKMIQAKTEKTEETTSE